MCRVCKPHALLGLVLVLIIPKHIVVALPRVHKVPKGSGNGGHEHALARAALVDHDLQELDFNIPGDDRSHGEHGKIPKGHGIEVKVIPPLSGLDPPEGEEILHNGTRGGHVGLDALGECPRYVDEELLLWAEASARLAGSHILDAILKLDIS